LLEAFFFPRGQLFSMTSENFIYDAPGDNFDHSFV